MPTVWPVGLPTKPLAGTYDEPQDDNLVKSEMAGGVVRQRRLNTKPIQYVAGTWQLDQGVEISPGVSEVDAFKTFFTETCLCGQVFFEMAHPRTGVTTNFYFDTVPIPRHKIGSQYEVPLRLRITDAEGN